MALHWKWADAADLEVLVRTRIQVLRAANQLDDAAYMSEVEECKRRGARFIILEATAAGRPLCESYGFVNMQDEMILPEV